MADKSFPNILALGQSLILSPDIADENEVWDDIRKYGLQLAADVAIRFSFIIKFNIPLC